MEWRWPAVLAGVWALGVPVVSVWAIGGRASFVPVWILFGGVVALATGFGAVWGRVRRRAWARAQGGAAGGGPRAADVVWMGAAGFLAATALWALAHPLYEETRLLTGRVVLSPLAEAPRWGPAVVSAERSAAFVSVWAGAAALAAGIGLTGLSRAAVRRVLMVLYGNGVVLAVAGIVFKLMGEPRVLGVFEPVSGLTFASFRYHNHWAAYALLMLGVGWGLANRARAVEGARGTRRRTEPMYWLGNGVLLLSLVFSTSRSGMLLGAFLLACFVVPRLFRAWRAARNRRAFAILAAAVPLAAAAVLAPLVHDVVERRWEQSRAQWTAAGGETVRVPDGIRFIDGPRLCVAMWSDRPLFGWGTGSFFLLFAEYADEGFVDQRGRLSYLEYAHTDFFQLLAEWGAAGALAFLLFWGGLWWAGRAPDPRHPLTAGVWQGLGAVFLLAVWEFPFGNPAVLAHAIVLAALMAAYLRHETA